MTYSVTFTPERISYKLMRLRWTVSDPSAPVMHNKPQALHDEHPAVVRYNLVQVGLSLEQAESIIYEGATVDLTQAQMADIGILLDRAELTD